MKQLPTDPSQKRQGTDMKVLVADDEIVSLKTLEIFVRKLGYEVLTAKNGQEAYDIWQRERPQLVITDWEMPYINGRDLCTRIRQWPQDNYTYIILVTSRDKVQDIVEGMHAGADDYITKPFNKDELNARIRAGKRIIDFQSKDILIFALAKLAESRDEDTGDHLERVRHYSKTLAETLYNSGDGSAELDSQLIDNIFLTSPLHDIGKVGIPDYVLLKPSRLDDNEFEVMKSHTIIGYKTLTEAMDKAPGAGYLRVAAEIARHHHEKWDGSGYPDGLKGDQIHIASRIFAIADVYDALVSKRPYKSPLSHERAKAIITDASGTHFDPVVVKAFLSCEQRFLEIFRSIGDI